MVRTFLFTLLLLQVFIDPSLNAFARKRRSIVKKSNTKKVKRKKVNTRKTPVKKTSKLLVNFQIHGNNVTGSKNKANAVGVAISLEGEHQLTEIIKAKIESGVVIETGSSESVQQNPYEPKKSLQLSEAIVEISPWNNLTFQGGAINQRHHNSPLFISSTAFLGAREILSYSNKQFKFELSAQQSIPSNKNLSTRLGSVDEGSPIFYSEKIKFQTIFDHIKSTLHIQHFAYDQLSAAVAYESEFLGNTINGSAKEQKSFSQQFMGWETGLETQIGLYQSINLLFSANLHRNTSANKGENTGLLLRLGAESPLSSGKLSLSLLNFKNEKNSAPAYYSSSRFGHTNRKGNGVEAKWQQKSDQLHIRGQYIHANVLEKNNLQSDDRIFYLELGKSHEIF